MKFNFDEIIRNNNKLRDYQIEAKEKIYEAWKENKAIMLQMPTGTGKTRLFTSIIKDIWNYTFEKRNIVRILILAHRKELIEQIQDSLYNKYGLAYGTIQAGSKSDEKFHVQIASVPTLSRDKRLNHWTNNQFNFIIVDEAHHILAKSYIKICEAFPSAKILGLTATPYRLNNQPFTDIFDLLIKSNSISEFIKEGWLCEYEYYSITSTSKLQNNIDNLEIDPITSDYADRAMSNALDNKKIRAKVVDTYINYAKGKKGIVYAINKNHCKNLCEQFIAKGINAVAIDSDTPSEERNDLVHKFKNNEIEIICNVNIFSEGFDCPDIEFIQLARPTKSLSLFLQQVGRGLRINQKKDKTIFLDNVGLYNRFGLPSAKRQWQHHFEGKNDWESNSYENDCDYDEINNEYKIEVKAIEEADDKIEQIFSNTTIKNSMILSEVAANLGLEVDEAITAIKSIGFEVSPNTIINSTFFTILLSYLDVKNNDDYNIFSEVDTKENAINEENDLILDNNNKSNDGEFVNIFNLETLLGIKLRAFRLVLDNSIEEIDCVNMIDCYIHVIKKIYNHFNGFNEDILEKLKIKKNLSDLRRGNILDENLYIETNLSNDDKLRILKLLLSKMSIKDSLFLKIANKRPRIKIKKECNKETILIYNNMEYNFDEIDEIEAVELMIALQEKVNNVFIEEKKALIYIEKLKQEIEKSKEVEEKKKRDREIKEKIESLGLNNEELLEFLLKEKESNNVKKLEIYDKKALESIVKKNIDRENEIKETKLNALKDKYNNKI